MLRWPFLTNHPFPSKIWNDIHGGSVLLAVVKTDKQDPAIEGQKTGRAIPGSACRWDGELCLARQKMQGSNLLHIQNIFHFFSLFLCCSFLLGSFLI
jgi:hypothetical protein